MIERAKKFCKEHKEDIIIAGSLIAVNATMYYVIAKTVSNGQKVTYIKYDNGDGPAPEMSDRFYVHYKNGSIDAFGYTPKK